MSARGQLIVDRLFWFDRWVHATDDLWAHEAELSRARWSWRLKTAIGIETPVTKALRRVARAYLEIQQAISRELLPALRRATIATAKFARALEAGPR